MSDLDHAYRWAERRLRDVGHAAVAERFRSASCRLDLDRTPICRAIQAAVDRVDLRRAAILDHRHAERWLAIHEDQAEVVRAALALQHVEVEG